MSSVNLSVLIPFLRLRVGDSDPLTYRYLDAWLLTAMQLAVKNLGRYWDDKYLVDSFYEVTRNPDSTKFDTDESYGVIESKDEYIIVLMSMIIILEGTLESSAWSTVSWADAEIRFTNIDGSRIREGNVKRLVDELNSLILSPTKKLANARKGHLPGYNNNDWEKTTEF